MGTKKDFHVARRVRFDIILHNIIRECQAGSEALMGRSADFASKQQRRGMRAAARGRGAQKRTRDPLKQAVYFLLRPFKRPARFVRRFLVAQVEADIRNLRKVVKARQTQLEQIVQSRTDILAAQLAVLQLSNQEIALRSRGALPIDEDTVALRTFDGFVFVPRQDVQLLLALLEAGPQGLEPGTRETLRKLLAPGMTFLDIGAHIGLLTLAGARAVGSSGRVLAIEPVPLSFSMLTRALAISGMAQYVEARCQAVGARREFRKLIIGKVLGHSSLIPSDGLIASSVSEIEVEVSSLDDLVSQSTRVDVVKIDVEGAELSVLHGMTRIISENPDLVIIAEFGPSHLKAQNITPDDWLAEFRKRGFESFILDELSGECRPFEPDLHSGLESANILFGRPDSPILGRAL